MMEIIDERDTFPPQESDFAGSCGGARRRRPRGEFLGCTGTSRIVGDDGQQEFRWAERIKRTKDAVKFKMGCSRHLYSLCVFDAYKANTLKQSLPQELGIGKGDRNLQFAQLMGMADGLSLGLRNAGFQVSKYLSYGPVEHIIPYLIRRAEENRGLLSASTFDRQLLRK